MEVEDVSFYENFHISEDLVSSRAQKIPATTHVDFGGLLNPPLILHEDLRGGCGGQLWPAGMVLAAYLLRSQQLATLKGKRILEIGAGCGLVGLAVARALKDQNPATSTLESSSSIEITDQRQMLSLMQRNVALNELSEHLVRPSILDWGDTSVTFEAPDILLAADCVYFEPAFPLLLQTMRDLISAKTICYFCFKKRRKADMKFLKDAKKLFHIEDILDDPDRPVWSKDALFLYAFSTVLIPQKENAKVSDLSQVQNHEKVFTMSELIGSRSIVALFLRMTFPQLVDRDVLRSRI